ncbi:hypothetical protein J2751_002640 [Halorubrum alkaliphilum]|uniref:Uncharacterized protein n=1 Tax=Halorubrum alkaliphilum TaxID=261290 RepID=A0A8T4GKS3_9EURY|nr:hypothetical protein [Halorubrum alkaliphilum]MBP1923595.1 hypothetical protein [Halorubrum alkaliphilum]
MSQDEPGNSWWRPMIAVTPDADDVLPWIRTLAVASGVLALLVLLFALELVGRL